jgi:hypothetical protein
MLECAVTSTDQPMQRVPPPLRIYMCNQDCDQGRTCICAMKDRGLFLDVMEELITLAVIIGIIVTFCFTVGYYWYKI